MNVHGGATTCFKTCLTLSTSGKKHAQRCCNVVLNHKQGMFCWYVHHHLFSSYFQSAWVEICKDFCHTRSLHPHFIYQQLSGGFPFVSVNVPIAWENTWWFKDNNNNSFQNFSTYRIWSSNTEGNRAQSQNTNGSQVWLLVGESSKNISSLFSCSDSTCLVNGIFEKKASIWW